jgi:gliding motility-associated-like protein
MLLVLPFMAAGQNLVPNPGFEDYNACPGGISAIDYSPGYTSFTWVKGWVNPVKNSSPDYMNRCAAPNTGVRIPECTFGYQWPRTGDAYAGIVVWEGHYSGSTLTTDFREYLQCKLLQPMVAGQRYCIVFYVSPTINIVAPFNFKAIDEIGVNFSGVQPTAVSGYNLSLSYSMVSAKNQFLTDTGSWIKISGDYIASGGEEWMTIGSFNNGNVPNRVQAHPLPASSTYNKERAYMYIDDVSVYPVSLKDTTITVHDSSFCTFNALPMTLNSSAADGIFTWGSGDGTHTITVASAGTYWCTSVTDCQVFIDTFKVQYKPDSKLNFATDLVNCNNQPVEIVPNKNFDTYNWSTGETTKNITVTTTGQYVLTATNECGTQIDTAFVYIQPPTPAPKAKDTMLCQLAEGVILNVEGSNLNWYTHPSGIVGIPVQPIIVTREVAKYSVYVTQTIGKCESPKSAINIDIRYQPRHILDDKAIMCLNDIQLIGRDVSHEVTYKWGTGETTFSIRPQYEGTHRVAINSPYCGTYLDSIRVVFSLCDTCFSLPNAFSPNRDNRNDIYKPILLCPIDYYHLSIYNRWGARVFETRDLNKGWDGLSGDVQADEGVYVYVLEYRSASTHMNKLVKGNITLIR